LDGSFTPTLTVNDHHQNSAFTGAFTGDNFAFKNDPDTVPNGSPVLEDTNMPVFQYIDPAVKDEMYRIYRDYNHGELGEIIHYGVFEPIGRAIENIRWQSDYWLWNDGEGSHANFFVISLDHFWHFQEHLAANHDQPTSEECDGEEQVCLSSSNRFAEELAQADHFEVERDILLTQLIGLSEPFMEEMEEAA